MKYGSEYDKLFYGLYIFFDSKFKSKEH